MKSVPKDVRNSLSAIAPVIVLALLFIAALDIVCHFKGYNVTFLWSDPYQITGGYYYYGLMSNIGVLFWCATAAICLFTYGTIKNKNLDKGVISFVLGSGLLTLYLTLDDFFMLHEIFIPMVFHIQQLVVYILYLILIGSYLFFFRNSILKSEYWIFIIAIALFGTSVLLDVYGHIVHLPYDSIGEEGAKFIGLLCWFMFFVRYCRASLHSLQSLQENQQT